MFIVNQDRDTTINLNNVKEIFVSQERIFADNTVIGKYKTEERTTQVYNDVKKCRIPAGCNEKLCKRKCDSAEKCGQRAGREVL